MAVSFPLPVKAVTIDLDGTLLDTVSDLAAAANMMLAELERPPLAQAQIRTFVGKGIVNLVQRTLAGHIDGVAEPATNVSAPAAATCAMLSDFTPPSTSSQMSRPLASMRFLTWRSLSRAEAMNDWPPNPGFTDITSTRSTLSITWSR